MKLDETEEKKIPTFECHCHDKRCTTALSSVHFWAKLIHRTAAVSPVTESSACTGEERMEGISTIRIQTAK